MELQQMQRWGRAESAKGKTWVYRTGIPYHGSISHMGLREGNHNVLGIQADWSQVLWLAPDTSAASDWKLVQGVCTNLNSEYGLSYMAFTSCQLEGNGSASKTPSQPSTDYMFVHNIWGETDRLKKLV